MDVFQDPGVWQIVLMWAAQTSKTDGVLNNVLGYHIDQDPAPLLMVYPRDKDAEKYSKVRVAPMIRDTPCLRNKVSDPKSRDGQNTTLEKSFPGGRVIFAGSNAPANLAGDPIRIVLGDEVDRWAFSAGTEGDPIELATTRTTTFPNRKVALTSTPTDETSRIAAAYEQSDQRRYFVPCPHCGMFQTLIWKQVRWDTDADGNHSPETARYYCEGCDQPWSEAERHAAVRGGEWRRTNPDVVDVAGFHLNALNAPWANSSLANLAKKWLRAQGKPDKLREFVNTVLAEVFENPTASVAKHDLAGRREVYPINTETGEPLVPRMAAVLLAGVDLQDDRIELQVIAAGAQGERWPIEYHVLDGDPSGPEVWDELWQQVAKPRALERGGYDYIRATAVDTGGHHTQAAYAWCKPRHRYRTPDGRKAYCFAVKGSSQGSKGDVWPRKPTIQGKQKTPLYVIRVDALKDSIYSRLQNHRPSFDLWGREVQPGVIHFPLVEGGEPYEFGDRYFEQLTAEKRVTETDKNGRERMVWRLKYEGARNEALDTFNYAEAALHGLEAMGLDLDELAESVTSKLPAYDDQRPPPPPSDDDPRPPAPPNPIEPTRPPVPVLQRPRRRRRRSRSSML